MCFNRILSDFVGLLLVFIGFYGIVWVFNGIQRYFHQVFLFRVLWVLWMIGTNGFKPHPMKNCPLRGPIFRQSPLNEKQVSTVVS